MDSLDQFITDWLRMEQSCHSRLLHQLKRELTEVRKSMTVPSPNTPASLPPDQKDALASAHPLASVRLSLRA